MKRLKRKYFKRRIDLIRYAIRRAIHRCDVEEPARRITVMEDQMKKNNWLEWATQKLREVR